MAARGLALLLAGALALAGCGTSPADPQREDKHVDQALLTAASAGDAAGVQSALDGGAAIETRDADQRTALLLAAAADHVDAAKVLVAAGADPDALDFQHDTPWLVTGVTGSIAMVDALWPARPDINGVVNRYGGISVIPASERGHVDYVRKVVGLGINVNHVNNLGWTALLECVILGDGSARYQEIAQILVDAGADVSIQDRDGVDALAHARARGYSELVSILSAR